MNLREDGKRNLVHMIDDASKSPTRPDKILKLSGIADKMDRVPKSNVSPPTRMTHAKALAFVLDNNMKK